MNQLTIIANIHAKPESIELIKAELEKLIPMTRAEKGCNNYVLYQNNADAGHFTFYENWESRGLWLAHMQAPHLAAFRDATQGAVEAFTLDELSQIS
uniref:putative quinol monooxygenase n=1 Tax=Marinobacterium profundum TaxID=1714300 RepID=UPI00082A6E2C|nr:putative quinol monooxygenase [Marinobacterium profundum]